MWFALQSAKGTSLVYAPTVIFACTTSLLALMTPRMLQELTGNDKVSDFKQGIFNSLIRSRKRSSQWRGLMLLFGIAASHRDNLIAASPPWRDRPRKNWEWVWVSEHAVSTSFHVAKQYDVCRFFTFAIPSSDYSFWLFGYFTFRKRSISFQELLNVQRKFYLEE